MEKNLTSIASEVNPIAPTLTQLRAEFSGQVIAPGDAHYEQARVVAYGSKDRQPAVILRPANSADVQRAIALARETGLELAVRSGGHSAAGHGSTHGGIVIDLKNMKGLDIDVQDRTAWAEGGLTAGEYTAAAAAHGLATGFGDTGSVGIAGITLGGGFGFLSRKYGMTIDQLLAAEVVTADGQLLHVDAHNYPDLFWALRGGGGNFGVVTRLKFQLHEVDQVVGGMLILPATVDVITALIAQADAAPEELTLIINVMSAPPMPFLPAETHGKLIVMIMMVYTGAVEEGQRVIAPFRALASPYADMIRPLRYIEMYPPEDSEDHPIAVTSGLYLNRVDDNAARTILDYLEASDAPMRVAQLRVLGGAIARVPSDATAYAHRKSRILANLVSLCASVEDQPLRKAWLAEFTAAMRQEDSAAYVNFMGDEGSARVHDAYPGATWERLAAVKARYDPTNLFRLNQNVPPQ